MNLVNPASEKISSRIILTFIALVTGAMAIDMPITQDAYLEGNTRKKDSHLKVENGNRVSYLKIDLSTLPATVNDATLRLTVDGDPGNGTITVHEGSDTSWTADNLSNSNKPIAGALLQSVAGTHGNGKVIDFDLTPFISSTSKTELSLVVSMNAGGNDVWFGSTRSGKPARFIVNDGGGGGSGGTGGTSGTYIESGGLVVMEMESTDSPLGQWQKKSALSGYSGSGYLQFNGNNYASGPATSPLEFTFTINQAGLYYLHMHCAKETHDGRTDVANDCYVRVEGDYTAGPAPHGSHGDNASLSLLKSDTKYFGGATNAWKWENGQNSSGGNGNLDPGGETNKRVAVYNFKAGETYKLIVSGRSKFFRLDRLVFRHTSTAASTAENLNTPVSQTTSSELSYVYDATTDFPDITSGDIEYYKDNGNNALAIAANIVANRTGFARASRTFDGVTGTYDVTITTMTEEDGESIYRLLVNGIQVATYTNPFVLDAANDSPLDLQPHTHTWSGVSIPNGATIAIESNADSNDQVSEAGDGNAPWAWARGRWRQIELSTSSEIVRPPSGRLAIVADGNSPDPDDIGATAVILGILKGAGLQDRLVHLSHSCDLDPFTNGGSQTIDAANELRRQNKLQALCGEGVGFFGPFPNLVDFYNCRTEQTAAVNDLRDAINASSATNPLWIIEAGEPDVIGYALQAATASKRQFVHVVSHHPANDNSGDFFTWQQILDFGVTEHQIGDQNVGLQVLISTGLWGWAEGHSNPAMVWILDQLKYAEADGVVGFQTNKYDCSDAGMIYWWITGATNGGNKSSTPVEIKELLLRESPVAAESNGPIAHWKLDKGTGTVAVDSSGNGYAGGILNGATWGSDATRSSYVSFDGTDDRISTAFSYSLSSSNNFTWAWWAKQAPGNSTGGIMLGNRYPEGAPGENYEFIKLMAHEAQFANTDAAGSIEKYDYVNLPASEWHHYALVKTGTSHQWYVDGVAQGNPVTINYNESSAIPFLIGGDDDGTGKPNEHFEGSIDDVVLYNRALAPAEVANVINGIYTPPVTMSGELKTWHKLSLSWAGPTSNETATPNPFSDFRLNVTFSHATSGKSYTVPGYFAADGNAAETSAQSGDIWRVNFAPDETGEWAYAVSFRTGTDIAISTSVGAGSSAGFFDGESGTFQITETDKAGRDLRGKGRLQYVNKHHLQFAGSGEYFLKAGVDAPENFLAYDDFDDTPNDQKNQPNLRKSWSLHAADYDVASASQFTWQSGKGTEILGAIKYLSDKGLNVFSFLTFSLDGDDDNVFPHRLKSTVAAYEAVSDNARWAHANGVYHDRFDISKMEQWARVFEYGTQMGMYLHFKTQETENDGRMDSGALGRERKLYYRELIARYGHNLALNWNLGEENTNTTAQQQSFAQWFYDLDPYRHNVVLHTYPNAKSTVYTPLLGSASKLTGLSLQTNQADFSKVFADTLTWVQNSTAASRPWVVACDEPGDAQHALRPVGDEGNSWTDGRKNALWGNIMAGGAGVEFYFGYQHAHSDLTLLDFRSRDGFWNYCRHMLDFFRVNQIPFQDMTNANNLVSGSGNNANRCLAKAGQAYVIQLYNGGSHTLNLSAAPGDFSVWWFDPRNGGSLQQGSVTSVTGGATVSLGNAPSAASSDWIVYVTNASSNGNTTNGAMNGLPSDADVRVDGEITNLAADNLVPGRSGASGGISRSTHFVFQLPNLGHVDNPFITSTLGFNVETVSSSPPNVDLYGLGKRDTGEVIAADYYGENPTPDPTDAALLQSNILTNSTGTGFKNSSASSALTAYLNTQYDGGNGIGKYIFLRLSTTSTISGLERHFITSADAAGSNGPRISFTAHTPQDFDKWLGLFTFPAGADTSPSGDADFDDLSNWAEYVFGLDPVDGSSVSPITLGLSKATGTFSYTRRNPVLTGISNYKVWFSEDLSGWTYDAAALQVPDGNHDIQEVTVTLSDTPLTEDTLFVKVSAE
ncbi:MAG: DUF5060 domain-containing protein [Akkermansiaceae bacterium]